MNVFVVKFFFLFSFFLDKAASSNKVLTQLYMYKIHHMAHKFVCGELHVGVYCMTIKFLVLENIEQCISKYSYAVLYD
jgi:hypothetical protein